MNTTGFRYAGAVVALTICSACSGGAGPSAVAPSATLNLEYKAGTAFLNGRPVTAARPNPYARNAAAALLAGGAANDTKYYDYIINNYGSYATIFDYPTGKKSIGMLNNVGGQGCTNVLYGYGKKIVWIVAGPDQISEYQVPAKLIKRLGVPSSDFPSSCAMDEAGDLAVGMLAGNDGGDMAIFKGATGSGTLIPTGIDREYFDGYDDKSNLFLDGFAGFVFQLDEIPKGSKKAIVISTSDTIGFPGSVQWDGKYVTVLDQNSNIIHQYTVSGSKAMLKGTVTLSGASDCAQSWIATGVVYCGDAGNDNGSVYSYPKGGKPLAVFKGNFDVPLGTTAAVK